MAIYLAGNPEVVISMDKFDSVRFFLHFMPWSVLVALIVAIQKTTASYKILIDTILTSLSWISSYVHLILIQKIIYYS